MSVCVQNTNFCQSAGRVIKLHSTTALVLSADKSRFVQILAQSIIKEVQKLFDPFSLSHVVRLIK